MATILVVDDEPVVLRVVARSLEMYGYGVIAASAADEALRLADLHAGPIELLILDHSTRDSSSQLAELRRRHPGLRILRYSGHTEEELRERGELPPGSSFLQKPFLPRQLLAAVEASLREVSGAGSG